MEFEITVVPQPARRLVGMKVRTTPTRASTDAPALWECFGPRSHEAHGAKECQGAYGPCIMIDEQTMDCWAAVEASPDRPIPEGMEVMTLPAGDYACAKVSSLADLSAAYAYVYGTWPHRQSDYVIDKTAPCYEHYPPTWSPEKPLEILLPVRRK